ncbi:hypothetical protein [Streptomyces iranensis]|uniref:hypothetical protein n=1 Tax=Streptomyces iranensis TaxID=576784 RepID=UPI0039B72EC2
MGLLDRLKEERGPALLHVTHDLATARHFSSEGMVMYRGEIVERGPSDEVILAPRHSCTQLLATPAPGSWPPPRPAPGRAGSRRGPRGRPGRRRGRGGTPERCEVVAGGGCRLRPRRDGGQRCRLELITCA